MKKTTAYRIVLTVLLGLLFLQSVVAQSATVNAGFPAATSSPESRQISSIRSQNTPNGSRVTITSNEKTLSDYGAYRNGDNFLVLIPGSELALTEINVKGTGFTDSKVEARGTNLAFSFHLDAGVSPSVSQTANRLEVTFTKADGANLGPSAERSEDATPESPGANPPVPPTALTRAPAASVNPNPTAAAIADAAPDNINDVQLDLTVPESPAFTVLGVTPETVSRPTIAKEFATSLLNGVDQNGNFQTGLALDFVPYLTFFGDQTSLASYAKNRLERFLARTQVSFATTKGVTEEDKSTRLALGLRMTLWDKGDPRLDDELETCYQGVFANSALSGPGTQPRESNDERVLRLATRKQLIADLTKDCDDVARKRNWNASGWIVGLAPSWISKTGQTKNFVWNGGGFWTSVAYGFDNIEALKDSSQVIIHARYRNNEVVPDTNNAGQFLSRDTIFLGGRLRVAPGSEPNSIFSLEGNFVRSRQNKGAFDNSSRYSVGFEQRLANNIWFSLAAGGQSGRADGSNQAFVLSSFKWGFSQK